MTRARRLPPASRLVAPGTPGGGTTRLSVIAISFIIRGVRWRRFMKTILRLELPQTSWGLKFGLRPVLNATGLRGNGRTIRQARSCRFFQLAHSFDGLIWMIGCRTAGGICVATGEGVDKIGPPALFQQPHDSGLGLG